MAGPLPAGPQAVLARSKDDDREYRMLIDGEWVAAASGKTFSCVDPFTEESWGRVPAADAADVARAVKAARRAFDKDGWPKTPPARRAALLRRLGQLIEENLDALVRQQIRENGRLVSEMRPGTAAVANACHYYA
ncbi:MAG TPA: aldehyde dehydrogenase family protein, partial [Gammaproteobacteria bacterium]